MDNKLKFDFVELQISSLRPVKLLFLHVFENNKDVSDIYKLVLFLARLKLLEILQALSKVKTASA